MARLEAQVASTILDVVDLITPSQHHGIQIDMFGNVGDTMQRAALDTIPTIFLVLRPVGSLTFLLAVADLDTFILETHHHWEIVAAAADQLGWLATTIDTDVLFGCDNLTRVWLGRRCSHRKGCC